MPASIAFREKIPHPSTESIDLATVMRALGDPVRLEIVRLLADGQTLPCGKICTHLGLPNSTVSYHLRTMREAGLTRHIAAGATRHVSLRRDDLEQRFPGLTDVLTKTTTA